MQSLLLASSLMINPLIGDISWTEGDPAHAPEVERIRAHLLFVAERLESSPTDDDTRARRAPILEALRAYAEAGVFPRHERAFAGRVPRFVDHRGVLCAVGHLVASTEGRAVAERIGAAHEYQRILEMNDPTIEAWARAHGFTLTELAMIQPSYRYVPPEPASRHAGGFASELRVSMPMLVTGVTMADENPLRTNPVGGGVEGGLGANLGQGIALLAFGGVAGNDATRSGPLLTGRAGIRAIWTIDAGCDVLSPQLGISAGLLLASTDHFGLSATGYGHVLAGARLRLTNEIALDASLALEAALPGAAFADLVAWVTPSIALSIGEARPARQEA